MARRISKKAKLLGGLVLAVMVLVMAGFWFFWRYWTELQSVTGDEFVRRVGAVTLQTESVTYNLVAGLNFIAFPVDPITVRSAAELIKDVGDAGGYVTMVSRWNGDRWQELARRGVEQYGNNFPLVPGEA